MGLRVRFQAISSRLASKYSKSKHIVIRKKRAFAIRIGSWGGHSERGAPSRGSRERRVMIWIVTLLEGRWGAQARSSLAP